MTVHKISLFISNQLILIVGILTIFNSNLLQSETASLTPTSSSLILNSSFIQSKIARRYHPSQNVKNPHVFLKLAGESGMLHHLSVSTLPPYFTTPSPYPATTKTTTTKTTTANALETALEHHYLFSPSQNSKLFSYAEKLVSTPSKSSHPSFHLESESEFGSNPKSKEQILSGGGGVVEEDSVGVTSSASAEDIELVQKRKQEQDYYSSESETELSDEVEELTPQQSQQHGPLPLYRSQNNLWSHSNSHPQTISTTAETTSPFNSLTSTSPYSLRLHQDGSRTSQMNQGQGHDLTSHQQFQHQHHHHHQQQKPERNFDFSAVPSNPHGTSYEQYSADSSVTPISSPTLQPTAKTIEKQKADRRADDIDHDLNDLLNLNPSLYPFTLNDFENGAVADDDQISRYFIKTKPRDRETGSQGQEQGRTTVSVSVSPIIDFTSSPPVTISRLNTVQTKSIYPYSDDQQQQQRHEIDIEEPSSAFLQSVTESNDSWKNSYFNKNSQQSSFGHSHPSQLQSTTTTTTTMSSNHHSLDLAESQQQHNSKAFDGQIFRHNNINYGQSSTSTVPATSTNSLPNVNDPQKDDYSLLTVPTPLPMTTTTDATSIPGMPGIDYPILGEVPYTGFDCQKQRYKGFFADVHTKCQAWHYCDFTDGHSTFLCPNGTLFSQVLLTCDWWFNVDCSQAQQLYVLNERLYRYIKPPKPSFPEDFHGPQVDLWLVQQLQLGLLPKMKKKVKDKVVIMGSH